MIVTKAVWQVRALTIANLKSRYRKTIAGFFWVVLNPLIMYGVQSLVFRKFLKLDVPNYALFLLSGLLPWIFMSQAIEMCTSIFVYSGQLLKSFPVHPLVYLFAQLADNTVNFFAAFILLLVPVWLYNPGKVAGLVVLPLAIIVLVLATAGMAWLLATLQVFLRDTRFIVSFVLSVAFFLTPVFYPATFVPENYAWLVTINPFYILINPFRVALYDFSFLRFFSALAGAFAVAALFVTTAFLYWRKKRNEVYLNI